jgi:hypothetical protein
MIRLTVVLIACVVLLGGCREGGEEPAAGVDVAGSQVLAGTTPETAQSRTVQALLRAIDELKDESPEAKGELRRALLDADDELAEAMGDTVTQLRDDASEKSVAVRQAGAPAPSKQPSSKPADDTDQPKTGIIKALVKVLDEIDLEDDEAGDELKTTLVEADKQLRQVLGGQSKRLIERANRKPPALVIGGRPATSAAKKPAPPAVEPGATPAKPPVPDSAAADGEPKTKIVRALIEAIDKMEDEDAETKRTLKQSLMQADQELSRLLDNGPK